MIMKSEDAPRALAKTHGLLQENNEEALKVLVREVIAESEKIVADYKAGKEAAIQGLVGQVMKKSKGSANPAVALKLLKEMV